MIFTLKVPKMRPVRGQLTDWWCVKAPLLAVYSSLGTIEMVRLLLEFSADVDKANNRYG